jgi:hypothetical protein
MIAAGNVTPGFLNYVLLLGLAAQARPSFVQTHPCQHGTIPFVLWDLSTESAA